MCKRREISIEAKKFGLQKTQIKSHVVSDHDSVGNPVSYVAGDFTKLWRGEDVASTDAVFPGRPDVAAGVDQSGVFVQEIAAPVRSDDGDFDYAIVRTGEVACGLGVDNGKIMIGELVA